MKNKLIYALLFAHCIQAQTILSTKSGDWIFLQKTGKHPTLLYLNCTGGKKEDIDSLRIIADSLRWNIAVCGKCKNHRDFFENEYDILELHKHLLSFPQVDSYHIVLAGFSGQGAQALGTGLRFPLLFGGIIAVCAHHGSIIDPDWKNARGLPIYLVTRTDDWNRSANEQMADLFSRVGINAKLTITSGQHGPQGFKEYFDGCKWIGAKSK